MPRVVFTPNLQRHIRCQSREVAGATVAEALNATFADQPTLRGYVLDDQQRLRKEMTLFIDGRPIVDRVQLRDAVSPTSEIYVLQALSGG